MRLLISTTLFGLAAVAVQADTFHTGNGSIDGSLCVGSFCLNDELFTDTPLRVKSDRINMEFVDISSTSFPSTDWTIKINDNTSFASGGEEHFSIIDNDTDNAVFRIDGGAPDNALFVDSAGQLGLGTSLPQEDLHITNLSTPTILLERTSVGSPYSWEILSDSSAIAIRDDTSSTAPFIIQDGAPTYSFYLFGNGNVGLGTNSPDAPLELSSFDTFNFFRITAEGAAVNDSVDITFTGGPLGTGQLRYNIVDGDNQEMSLDANGNMVLDGTLTTAGPTCAGGCDRVFDADYPLPSIQDHAAQMFAAGYLPQIGATIPHAPVNLSERQGNIINSLEHAHIFIAKQQDVISRQQAMLKEVFARLDALETENRN